VTADGALRAVAREVDLGALARNYDRLRSRLPRGMRVIASVKANAYGHGVVEVVRTLERIGVDAVATASLAEAIELRGAGVEGRILLFGGQPPEAADLIVRHGLIPTVSSPGSARALAAAAGGRHGVYVKVDSGLGRLGVSLAEAAELLRTLRELPALHVEGLYTHLPFADAEGERWARERLAEFVRLRDRLRGDGLAPPLAQALSSPGVAAGLPNPFEAVCCGRLLYGLVPRVGRANAWGLEPVLRSIRTRLVHVSHQRAGTRIGSGGRYSVGQATTSGVIPFGQAEGYASARSGRAFVLHRGRRVPVIGVALEHATVDLGQAAPTAEVGDEIVLLGAMGDEEITLAELAVARDESELDVLVALDRGAPTTYVT
jgi:alanine racemase